MAEVIVYHKPTCSTSRKVVNTLNEKGAEYKIINYYETPFTKTKLNELLGMMNMKPSELIRKKESAYKELDFKNNNYTESDILNFMVNNPDLIERPIVQKGAEVILARPSERINDFLK